MTSFCANVVLTYGVAFVLSVVFEAPLMNVEKLLLMSSA